MIAYDRASSNIGYLRGFALIQLQRGREAVKEFQQLVEHRGRNAGTQYPLYHLGLARSAALAGDVAAARRAYDEFFSWWKDADETTPLLMRARAEHAALPDAR